MFAKFHRFEDENPSSTREATPLCRYGCGRRAMRGLSRLLRPVRVCCKSCTSGKAALHDTLCNSNWERETTGDSETAHSSESRGVHSSRSHVISSLHSLMSAIPKVDVDLDYNSARAIVESICAVNRLPCIDEKESVLLYSRFVDAAGEISPESAKRFFFSVFKRIMRYVRVPENSLAVSRYFFVTKNAKISKHYRFKAVIGQGSFGIVHKVVHIASGQERVCKSVAKGTSSVPIQQLEAEIRIIAQLDHPNIIRMYEFFEDDFHIHLIMENCKNGDLMARIKTSIKTQVPLPIDFVMAVVKQVLQSLAFMRNHRVVHKDLKPENVMLIDSSWNPLNPAVKIIDMGLSEMFSPTQESSSTVAGTAFFMAPEIFRPPFNYKCDVWSCGVITFFMLTGFLPFFGTTVGEVKSNVLYRRLQWPENFAGSNKQLLVSDEAKDFVEKLLEKDPKLRVEAVDALNHPWMLGLEGNRSPLFSLPLALNMCAFSKFSFLKRAMINLASHVWEFEEEDNIRDVFNEIDSYQRGFITIPELAERLTIVGTPVSHAWKAANAVDLTGTGRVTFTALTASMISPLLNSDVRISKAVFHIFEPDKSGKISTDAMWQVLSGQKCALQLLNDCSDKSEFARRVFEDMHGAPGGAHDLFCDVSDGQTIDFRTFRNWFTAPQY